MEWLVALLVLLGLGAVAGLVWLHFGRDPVGLTASSPRRSGAPFAPAAYDRTATTRWRAGETPGRSRTPPARRPGTRRAARSRRPGCAAAAPRVPPPRRGLSGSAPSGSSGCRPRAR